MRSDRFACTAVSVALAAAILASGPATSRADGSEAVSWDGRCTEIASGWDVPADRVRHLVPSEFTILGERFGAASLNVGIGQCSTVIVDGVTRSPGFFSFVAVWIEPYEGVEPQRYLLWMAASERSLHDRVVDLGVTSMHAPDMSVALERLDDRPLSGTRAEGTVPRIGNDGGYGLTTETLVASAPAPASFDAVYWHSGPAGLVRMHFAVELHDTGYGPAELRAEPGTTMAAIVGAETASGNTLLADLSFRGTIAPVPPD